MKEKIKLANSKVGGLKNKAFTLIELLAIIIVLAIIAVITVPIILNVIENSRKGAAVDSAYGYKKAVNQHYLTKLANDDDFELEGFYTINNEGALTQEDSEPIQISFAGTTPKDGMVYIDNGNIVFGCITINDYKVRITSEEIEYAEKGNCLDLPQISGKEIEKVKYYDTEIVNDENQITTVYFNPTTGFRCLKKEYESNDQKLGKTGCMKWYAYSEFTGEDGNAYVNMLLDHNTTLGIKWISIEHWTTPPTNTGIQYPPGTTFDDDSYGLYGNSKKGPLTVLFQLHKDTDGWNLPTRNDEYTPATNSYSNYTIDHSRYKARLISAEEIAKITGRKSWGISSSGFSFGQSLSGSQPGSNAYAWLFTNLTDCEEYGCKANESTEPSTDVMGYWTSSPNLSDYFYAWDVRYNGSSQRYNVIGTNHGIRPVITVPKYIFN